MPIETRVVECAKKKAAKEIEQHLKFGWRVASQEPPVLWSLIAVKITFERENDDTSGLYPFRLPTLAPAPATNGVADIDAAIGLLTRAGYTVIPPAEE